MEDEFAAFVGSQIRSRRRRRAELERERHRRALRFRILVFVMLILLALISWRAVGNPAAWQASGLGS